MTSNLTKFVLIVSMFLANYSFAGENINLHLKSGTENISAQTTDQQYDLLNNTGDFLYLVSFAEIPDLNRREMLSASGVEFFGYLPDNSFYVGIPKNISYNDVEGLNAFAINRIEPVMKYDPTLLNDVPEWTMKDNGDIELILSYFEPLNQQEYSELRKHNIDVVQNHPSGKWIHVTTDIDNLENVSKVSFVYFIEPIDPPAFPENSTGRTLHRSNMLNEAYYGGRNYDGSGIKVGMHDDGIIGPHIDYHGRVPIQFTTNNSGNHGDHVSGTIMGAGNLDPLAMGMAPGARLYVYSSSNDNYDSVPSHYNNHGVIITSKSYSNGCNNGYTNLTRQLDQQTRTLPSLIHVFSAGNDGNSNCGYGAGAGWGNITGGHKMGKNVIATGNLTRQDVIAGSSSRGPADDGRVKPDICAKGTSVHSTIAANDYDSYTGTSMACPGISGSLAQLYDAYKDFNGGQNPPSGLMKGTLLNTADDLGNPGPDFIHGWGRVNLRKALEVIENNQYFVGQASSTTNTHSISVPPNAQFLKIMVYWHDHEASTSAARALVNNLDMVVTDPASNNLLPWVLDPTPNVSNLSANATRAVDSLNNMEQVTVENPASGTYTVDIIPTSVPQGPQEYFVVYEIGHNEIYVTYPNGGEGLVPGETEVIRWDAPGNTSSFDLEYTSDGGNSWNSIATNISPSTRYYNWNVPNDITSEARVRISRGSISDDSDAYFSIIGIPGNLEVDWICPDSMKISWDTVALGSDYTVYRLGSMYMDSISTTQQNSFVFHNTDPNKHYWMSVNANIGASGRGRRALAIQSNTGVHNCPVNDDGSVAGYSSPLIGTYFACDPDIKVSMYVKNPGLNTISGVPVFCNLNGSTALSGLLNDSILPGDSTLFQLSGSLFPSLGINELECFTLYPGDSNKLNDTMITIFDYRSGTLVTPPWSENFEEYLRCGTSANCGNTRCPLGNGWVNDSTYVIDESDWRIDDQGTPSGQTGPDEDHNPGNISGNYLYTEASEGCSFRTIQLTTPCFDLGDAKEPYFYFWYHMYGIEMGYLHVDILSDGSWKLNVIAPKGGNLGDFWRPDSVNLEPYVGSIINLRFRGVTGDGYRSDMAIDDINLIDKYDPPIGVKSPSKEKKLHIFPNPANDVINITWSGIEEPIEVQITDLAGHSLQRKQLSGRSFGRSTMDISNLPAGVYLVNISDGSEQWMEKVVVM